MLEMKVGAISKKEVGEMKRTLWCIFSLALIVALLSALAPQSLAALKNVGIIKGDFSPTNAGIIKGDFAPTAGIIKGDLAPTAGIIKGDFAPTAGIIKGDFAPTA